MADGAYRSLHGSWVGGVSAPQPAAVTAGYRSIYGLWLGGIAAPAAAPVQAGYRSLTAMWMGGATSGASTSYNPGGYVRTEYQIAYDRLQQRKRRVRRIHKDDEELLELLAMFTGSFDC